MWWQSENEFMYMYVKEFSIVNNNRTPKLFSLSPFYVAAKEKEAWATSGKSLRLSPETLTYWNEE